ncbi:hypothetical protein AU074_30660 [Pseudomonas sp. ATCC PTA-122608]|nr:hypothetical protein AU074_30660 [Pseudomonas sp. ATCC PTA-122608]
MFQLRAMQLKPLAQHSLGGNLDQAGAVAFDLTLYRPDVGLDQGRVSRRRINLRRLYWGGGERLVSAGVWSGRRRH